MNTYETTVAGRALAETDTDRVQGITINALADIGDFGEAMHWVRWMAGQGTVNEAVKAFQKKLSLCRTSAEQVVKDAVEPEDPEVVPKDVLTPEGAQKIAKAGRKAQVAARFHNDNANKLDATIKGLRKRIAAVAEPGLRADLEMSAAAKARKLLAERAQATRAVLVGGATLSALKFRQKALRAKNEEERKARFGQGAAAISAGKHIARTKLKVTLPKSLVDAGKLPTTAPGKFQRFRPVYGKPSAPGRPRVEVNAAFHANARRMNTAAIPKSAGVPGPTLLPPFPTKQVQQPMTGVARATQGLPYIPSAAGAAKGWSEATPPIMADRTVTASLAGLDALGDFSLDSILQVASNVASSILPAAQSVSAALQGAWGNAVAGGVVAVNTAMNGPQPGGAAVTVQYQQGPPEPLSAQQRQVQDSILNSAGEVAPPNMPGTPGLPKWTLPALGVGILGVGAALVLL